MPDMEGIKNFLKGLDARAYTTPLGAIAGLAAVRSLVPEEKRTWKAYGLGGAGGAGLGFAAGTGVEAFREELAKQKKQRTLPEPEPAIKPKAEGPPAPPVKAQTRLTGAGTLTPEQENRLSAVSEFMGEQTKPTGVTDQPRSEIALPNYYELMPVKTRMGFSWFDQAKPSKQERATAIAANGGLPKLTSKQNFAALFKSLFSSTAYSQRGWLYRHKGSPELGKTDKRTLARDFLADRAREYRGSDDPKKQAHYRSVARLLQYDFNNSLADTLAYEARLDYLTKKKENRALKPTQLQAIDATIGAVRGQLTTAKQNSIEKSINILLWRYPGWSFIGAMHPAAAGFQMMQEGRVGAQE